MPRQHLGRLQLLQSACGDDDRGQAGDEQESDGGGDAERIAGFDVVKVSPQTAADDEGACKSARDAGREEDESVAQYQAIEIGESGTDSEADAELAQPLPDVEGDEPSETDDRDRKHQARKDVEQQREQGRWLRW